MSKLSQFFTRKDPLFFCLRLLAFLPLLTLLTLLPAFERLVEQPLIRFNAWLAWLILRGFGASAVLQGSVVHSSRFSMEVVSGCTGMFVFLLLSVSIASYPADWPMKLKGILVGAAVIGILNQVRLVTLFIIGNHFPGYFEEIHVYLWKGAIIVLVILYWYLWARRALVGLEPAVPQPEARP